MEDFCRIEVENKPYFIFIKPENDYIDGFEITISNGQQAWKKMVGKEEVRQMSEAIDMNIPEYTKQTKAALTGTALTHDVTYIYQVILQDQTMQFAWKKSLQDGIKFQLGSLWLNKISDSPATIMDMFTCAARQINQFKENIGHLQSENKRLSQEREHAVELLDKCVTARDDMEKELYFKFASVLNKKKEKIRQLKSIVEDLDQDKVDGNQNKNLQSTARSPASEDRSRTPSPVHSDTGSNEDRPDEERPSTSGLQPLEDNDEIITHAKRRRRRGPQKETPKSKLVLPKVSSIKKTLSNSSTDSSSSVPRLRKRHSEKSEPDPDDLMAEMAL